MRTLVFEFDSDQVAAQVMARLEHIHSFGPNAYIATQLARALVTANYYCKEAVEHKEHMRILKTKYTVELTGNNYKVWRVVECDTDPDLKGATVSNGLPMRASEAPLGTTFETVLTIPDITPAVPIAKNLENRGKAEKGVGELTSGNGVDGADTAEE